ncbi:hypothetical protein LCGC14_1028580 [marine sediment metagenome]|uniref:Uncharacterized protein n=1 Tax=marine sediment metagenome TaxID=412755 RepID=A0A0F9NH12_9ZZZZ
MTYTELQDLDLLDLRSVLNFPSLDTPIFYPLQLFTIFMVFALMTFFREVQREGKGNILSSLAIAGYVTTAVALIYTLLDLIQTEIMVLVLVISLVFQVLFLLTNR